MLDIAALLVTLTAVFSYINHRFIKLPTTIGVMMIALLMSLLLIVLSISGYDTVTHAATGVIGAIDFNAVLMNGMLSFLLFAGALHVDLTELANRKWTIGLLATVGVIASTLLIGTLAWLVFDYLGGFSMPYIYWLLLGALISPTDPIAVLGIMKAAQAPRSLEIKIVGESLFNDGVAVVVFTILLAMAIGQGGFDLTAAVTLFGRETLGGIVFGLLLGYGVYAMLKSIDSYNVEVLLTLALVLGGYALALHLHISGPIAMVVAGLVIGNHGRRRAMSDTTRFYLDTFWEIVDEMLNAVLFVLIGLELIILSLAVEQLWIAFLMIPIALLARFICVSIPLNVLRTQGFEYTPHAVKLLTWGGIRGGISVALALSLPVSAERDLIVTVTYVVVLFSILIQGLSIGRVIRLALRDYQSDAASS